MARRETDGPGTGRLGRRRKKRAEWRNGSAGRGLWVAFVVAAPVRGSAASGILHLVGVQMVLTRPTAYYPAGFLEGFGLSCRGMQCGIRSPYCAV